MKQQINNITKIDSFKINKMLKELNSLLDPNNPSTRYDLIKSLHNQNLKYGCLTEKQMELITEIYNKTKISKKVFKKLNLLITKFSKNPKNRNYIFFTDLALSYRKWGTFTPKQLSCIDDNFNQYFGNLEV